LAHLGGWEYVGGGGVECDASWRGRSFARGPAGVVGNVDFGPSALTAAAFLIAAPCAVSVALADGGQGGNPSGGSPDGRGGSGFTGNAGEDSFNDGAGRGGGGGGAGGGNGGIGNNGFGNAPGGAGGTSFSKDGVNGTDDPFGAGGGGGGYNGNGPGAASITNSSALAGGNGGRGGNTVLGDGGGGGGAGGYGAVVLSGGASSNSSGITGGNGGIGGIGASGGDGGIGVWFDAPGAAFTNSGTVTGGNGGAGVAGSFGGANGLGGVGGAGADLTVIMNGGSIAGGMGGDGVTRADAIAFAGGNNTLTLNGGSLTGNVSIAGGNISFNQAGSYNLTNVITGTGSISHDGTGTLTLSNANTYSGGTTVSAGTLVANHQDGVTGAVPGTGRIDALGSGPVILDGGGLRTSVTGYLATDILFNSNKTSTISASTGTTLTIGGDPGLPGDPFASSTGNLPARIVIGPNAVAQFGTATDTGTIQIGASSTIRPFDIDPSSHIVVAGGTLRDLNDQLAILTFFAASTTVNAGATLDFNGATVQVINNLGGSGNVMMGTNAGGPLQLGVTSGTTQTFGGVISGARGVFIAATGLSDATMVFSGDNTYTGGTEICSCTTLQLGNGGTTGSILGNVINGGTLAFNRSNSYTFNGVISDDPFGFTGGQVKQIGTGNTILTAVSTYTGNTTIDAGTLSVNGDIRTSSGVTVNSGATLGGTGYVPDTVINAGGTLAPGNSIGTLNVMGNLTFNAGAYYNVEVSPSAADRTNVTGNATLNGATVNAIFALGSYVTKQYTILNTTGTVNGTFGTLVNTNLPSNFTSTLSYDAKNAYLDLTLNFTPPPGPTPPSFGNGLSGNQNNVGNALVNYFNTTGGIPLVFGLLSPVGLTQVSGEPGASVPTAGFAAMGQFINAIIDNVGGNNNQGGALGFAEENAYAPGRKLSAKQTDAYAAVTPRDRLAAPFASRWQVWATGYGGNGTVDGNTTTGTHTTSARVYGTAVAADYRATPDTRFGFALGGAGTNFSVDSALGGGRADVFQAAAYARHNIGAAYVFGALAYGWQNVTTDRTLTVSGTDKLHATFNASTLAARLETGWRYAMPAVAVTPYAAAQSTAFYLPSYAEAATTGSNQFALSYASKTVTATRGELGARFDKAMPLRDTLLTLRARAAWAHDWNSDRSATATFQTLPGATFVVNGAQPAANAALISAGADVAWGNGLTVAANFDGEFSRTTAGYAGRGSLKYAW